MITSVTRLYVLRALHNLQNPNASDAENERLYGLCYRLHGHHYKIMVTIESEVDPRSGLCRSRENLDEVVRRHLITPLEGQNLNNIYQNTSGEALTHLFFERLRPHIPADIRLKVSIQETRKNYFECP